MRAWILVTLLVPLAGCSFIDDFGSFTTTPTGPMDAGDRDGGGDEMDGGSDDGGGECDRCGAGCATGETCVFVPEAECRECRPAGSGNEGDPCMDPSECNAGLTCLGVCVIECVDSSSCVSSMVGPYCIMLGGGEQVCFRDLCDPVERGTCGADNACSLVGADEEGNMGTACTVDDGTGAPLGTECDAGGRCEEGALCVDLDADGVNLCERLCYADGTDCDDGRACLGVSFSMSGAAAQVGGRPLGLCFGGLARQGETCASNEDCYAMALCWAGQCRMACMTDTDCPAGTLCMDLDGDGTTECR